MKKLLLAPALVLALLVSAPAGTVKVPKKEPVASIQFPDSWKITAEDDSFEAESPDEEIYFYVEAYEASSIDKAVDEAVAFLEKENVLVKKDTLKEQKDTLNGMPVVDISFEGKDKDGLCNVSLTFFVVSKEKILSFIYWASQEGEKKHGAELKAIYHSIKRLE